MKFFIRCNSQSKNPNIGVFSPQMIIQNILSISFISKLFCNEKKKKQLSL